MVFIAAEASVRHDLIPEGFSVNSEQGCAFEKHSTRMHKNGGSYAVSLLWSS